MCRSLCTFLAACFWLITLPPAVAETRPSSQSGTILLLDKDNDQCALTVPGEGTGQRVQYELNLEDYYENSNCYNLQPRQIKFDNLPSAARILITDGLGCTKETRSDDDDDENDQDTRNFWIELRTTRKDTSSGWFEVDDLVTFNTGEIISPGLQMVDKYVKQPSLARDTASCIRITTSSATEPPTPTPIATGSSQSFTHKASIEDFTCPANMIITHRRHEGDENGQTSYLCTTFTQGSTSLVTTKAAWGKKVKEHLAGYFMCPPNTVMTGRQHAGDEEGETRYQCSELHNGQTPLQIIWSDGWSEKQRESSSSFTCPNNEFLVGRFHLGDENKDTRYRCATAQ
ncbi:hypothetical protein [Pseudomonas faucium]|uniref:hypothetical protein n=1 Tax=Pseudomonas faucium TaxID=2740518 RepID=UPI001F195574|nr:hypothetical protein [Pseudomonas faucium]